MCSTPITFCNSDTQQPRQHKHTRTHLYSKGIQHSRHTQGAHQAAQRVPQAASIPLFEPSHGTECRPHLKGTQAAAADFDKKAIECVCSTRPEQYFWPYSGHTAVHNMPPSAPHSVLTLALARRSSRVCCTSTNHVDITSLLFPIYTPPTNQQPLQETHCTQKPGLQGRNPYKRGAG
jgi:hypothetical protein